MDGGAEGVSAVVGYWLSLVSVLSDGQKLLAVVPDWPVHLKEQGWERKIGE